MFFVYKEFIFYFNVILTGGKVQVYSLQDNDVIQGKMKILSISCANMKFYCDVADWMGANNK